MNKEHLIIRNFGPIENVELKLKKINVFIGEQGVGKSTIAKLYSCMQDIFLHFLILFDDNQNKIKAVFKRYGIQSYFLADTYIEFHTIAGFVVKYEEGKFKISHPKYNEEQMKMFVIELLKDSLEHSFSGAGFSMDADFDDLPDKEKEIVVSNMRTSFYIPAERSLVGCVSNSLYSMIAAKIPLPKML